jgi:hypothetical protein
MSINQSSFERLVTSIEACNNNALGYLSATDGSLKIRGLHNDAKMPDTAVVALFFECLQQVYTLSNEKSAEILQKMRTFIQKSLEISDQQKVEFIETTQKELLLHRERDTWCTSEVLKYLDIARIRQLKYREVQRLEMYLSLMCGERLSVTIMFLYACSEYYQNHITNKLISLEGITCSKHSNKNCYEHRISYDDLFNTMSGEEASIAFTIESRYNQSSGSKFKKYFSGVLQEHPTYNEFTIIKAFKLFSLLDGMQNLKSFLEYFDRSVSSGHDDILYSQDANAMDKELEFSIKTLKHFDKKILGTIFGILNSYKQKIPIISDVYRRGYAVLQQQIEKQQRYTHIEIDPVLNGRLLTPDELDAMILPELSQDEFDQKLTSDLDLIASQNPQEDSSFFMRHFVGYFLPEQQCLEFEKQYCKFFKIDKFYTKKQHPAATQESLVDQVAALTLQSEPTQTASSSSQSSTKSSSKPSGKKTKSRGINQRQHHPNYKQPQPQPPTQTTITSSIHTISTTDIHTEVVGAKSKTAAKPAYQITPILAAFRVRDWLKNTPSALQKESYACLPDAEKTKEEIFHSYPITITHLMRQYGKAESWQAKTTRKTFALYSQPGTIEWNGNKFQGYFADSFDGSILYHHYFHERPLHVLRDRYKTSNLFTDQTDKSDIEKDASSIADNHNVEIQGRFTICKKHFSAAITDTENNIVYTICFPDGIDNED